MAEPTDPTQRTDRETPAADGASARAGSADAPGPPPAAPPPIDIEKRAGGASRATGDGSSGASPAGSGGEPPGDPPGENDGAPDDGLTPPQRARRRLWAHRRRRARAFVGSAGKVVLALVLFCVVIFFDRIVHSVYPGEIGVLWSRFFGGTQLDAVYREGMVVTWPWDEFYIYDVREQELNRQTVIYAQDGLEITVHTSVRYRPQADQIPQLHQDVGPDYVRKVVEPETISTLRRVLGNYTPEMIYAKDEQGLLRELSETLRGELDPDFFEITEFLVLELRLPVAIEDAIKSKLTQEQQMLSYRFRLETEKDEKERRIIEAEGLKAFETISGVPILKWRGIEATEALARSPSAKIVLMGTGGDQLPIILNADVPTPTPSTTRAAAEPTGEPTDTAGQLDAPAPATLSQPRAPVIPSAGRQLPERPRSRASDATAPRDRAPAPAPREDITSPSSDPGPAPPPPASITPTPDEVR